MMTPSLECHSAEAEWTRITSSELNRNCPLKQITLAINAAITAFFVFMFMFGTSLDAVFAALLLLR